jgi:hypothetical protein
MPRKPQHFASGVFKLLQKLILKLLQKLLYKLRKSPILSMVLDIT